MKAKNNTYQVVFIELQKVIPNGRTLQNVMDALKRQGVITGNFTEPIEWLFNFSGGGWNSVMAKTLKEANLKIKKQYGDSKISVPDYRTTRPSTKEEYDSLMRNFN